MAIGATKRIRAAHQRWREYFPTAKPGDFGDAERIQVAGKTFLVGYDGSHWTVQPATETSDAEQS